MAKDLFIGYDEQSDELIITSNPKAKTVGYFIDSGTAVLLGIRDFVPYGFSFILLKEYFKRHKNAFAKIPLKGVAELPLAAKKQLQSGSNSKR